MATIAQATLDKMTDRSLDVEEVVIIHHTAANNQREDILDIAAEEERDQGFVWAGYHFVVWGDGTIQVGRPLGKVPAANLGMNTPSVAICLEGNFHPPDHGYRGEKPSDAQIHAAIKIVNEWVKPKCKNLKHLNGHRDVARIVATPSDATACPGDLLYARLHEIRAATGLTAL